MLTVETRDHGGGVDAAAARFGGRRIEWIDLSTGINPVAYSTTGVRENAWKHLPDTAAFDALYAAARIFWNIPAGADVICANGASALISCIPALSKPDTVAIPAPTYNEHAAAFTRHGWRIRQDGPALAQIVVNPNNPDGRFWQFDTLPTNNAALTVIDESFCDLNPDASLIEHSARPGTLVLKSFGKFWGLAGLRLGFAIGEARLIGQLRESLGPWPVSGPALKIGAAALADPAWAVETRTRLLGDSARLDSLLHAAGAECIGGTTLFRLYRVDDARQWQERLARCRIWSRVFPYDPTWLRLGIPHPDHWSRLEAALT